jgi:hypothetical protein
MEVSQFPLVLTVSDSCSVLSEPENQGTTAEASKIREMFEAVCCFSHFGLWVITDFKPCHPQAHFRLVAPTNGKVACRRRKSLSWLVTWSVWCRASLLVEESEATRTSTGQYSQDREMLLAAEEPFNSALSLCFLAANGSF